MRIIKNFILYGLLCASSAVALADNSPANPEQVYQLLRSNLGVNQTQLDRNAVKGLLAEFPGQVMLIKNGANEAEGAETLRKVALYDDAFVYFRVGQVESNLAEQLRADYQSMVKTNKSPIKGLILDLRFAGGTDYQAASAAADCFLNSDRPLLEWGAGAARASAKTNAITAPVAILVNGQTTGAAEALAAGMREGSVGLIIGSTTAGQANIFKDFPLDNGDKLRIATSQIKLGNGTVLSNGVKPDIGIECSLSDEKAYLKNPYATLHGAAAQNGQTNAAPRRPTNEAELVREHRAGQSDDDANESPDLTDTSITVPAPPPIINDPVLAGAIDLLKGIAVLQLSHPG